MIPTYDNKKLQKAISVFFGIGGLMNLGMWNYTRDPYHLISAGLLVAMSLGMYRLYRIQQSKEDPEAITEQECYLP